MERSIKTFAIIDLETTGLIGPGERPRITEISVVAVHRTSVVGGKQSNLPRVLDKLNVCLYPQKPIGMVASQITGLYNQPLSYQRDFDAGLADMLVSFLNRHEAPVCLLAHNGIKFDFPILKSELACIEKVLPNDILIADSLEMIRDLDDQFHLTVTTHKKMEEMVQEFPSPPLQPNVSYVANGADTPYKPTMLKSKSCNCVDVHCCISSRVIKRKLFPDGDGEQITMPPPKLICRESTECNLRRYSSSSTLSLESHPSQTTTIKLSSSSEGLDEEAYEKDGHPRLKHRCCVSPGLVKKYGLPLFNENDQPLEKLDTFILKPSDPASSSCDASCASSSSRLILDKSLSPDSEDTIPYWVAQDLKNTSPTRVASEEELNKNVTSYWELLADHDDLADDVLANIKLPGYDEGKGFNVNDEFNFGNRGGNLATVKPLKSNSFDSDTYSQGFVCQLEDDEQKTHDECIKVKKGPVSLHKNSKKLLRPVFNENTSNFSPDSKEPSKADLQEIAAHLVPSGEEYDIHSDNDESSRSATDVMSDMELSPHQSPKNQICCDKQNNDSVQLSTTSPLKSPKSSLGSQLCLRDQHEGDLSLHKASTSTPPKCVNISPSFKNVLHDIPTCKVSYKLTNIYQRLFGSYPRDEHNAEADCATLLSILCRLAPHSLSWLDMNARPWSDATLAFQPVKRSPLPPGVFPYQI